MEAHTSRLDSFRQRCHELSIHPHPLVSYWALIFRSRLQLRSQIEVQLDREISSDDDSANCELALDLPTSHLSDRDFTALSFSLHGNQSPRVVFLNISGNALHKKTAAYLGSGLAQCRGSLKHLVLHSCKVTDDMFAFLASKLMDGTRYTALQTLDVSNNSLTSACAETAAQLVVRRFGP